MLEFVHEFKPLFYYWWLNCSLVVVVILAAMLYDEKFRLWPLWSVRKHIQIGWCAYCRILFKGIWRMVSTVIGQEGLNFNEAHPRILWLFYCLATFVVVFGYSIRFLKADPIAVIESPRIDTVYDLLDIENIYPGAQLVALKNSFLYNHLKSAPKGSLEHQLFLFFNDNSKFDDGCQACWLTLGGDESANGPVSFIEHLTRLQRYRGGGGIVIEDAVFHLLRHVLCSLEPRLYSQWDMSQEVIAPGIVTSIFNKHASTTLKQYVDYMGLTQLEMSTLDKDFATATDAITDDMITTGPSLRLYQCLVGYQQKWEMFGQITVRFRLLMNTLRLSGVCVILAVVVLLVEVLLRRFSVWSSNRELRTD